MSERWLGAAFYFPASDLEPGAWLKEVAGRLGLPASSVGSLGSSYASMPLEWAGLRSEALCVDGEHRRVLLIRFLQAAYLDLISESTMTPPAAPLIADFIKVCNDLAPELALIVTALPYDLEEYVSGLDGLVAAGDLERILWSRPGCVYVSDAWGAERLWEYPWPVERVSAGSVAITGVPPEDWVSMR